MGKYPIQYYERAGAAQCAVEDEGYSYILISPDGENFAVASCANEKEVADLLEIGWKFIFR